jgi:D-alanyl-D-alanine carboxypeptidase
MKKNIALKRHLYFILSVLIIGGFIFILSNFAFASSTPYAQLTTFAFASSSSAMSSGGTCNNLQVLVDKTYGLSENYVPSDLVSLADYAIPAGSPSVMGRKVMINDLQRLFVAVKKAGIHDLKAVSVYRSYKLQASVYNSYVQIYGVSATDKFSARPGHSQHQLGTAIDFSTTELGLHYMLSDVFAQTKAGQWLLANAYKYGFYLSYPQGQEKIIGYDYEPWHFRYIGVSNALALHQSHQLMQTYLIQKGIKPHC